MQSELEPESVGEKKRTSQARSFGPSSWVTWTTANRQDDRKGYDQYLGLISKEECLGTCAERVPACGVCGRGVSDMKLGTRPSVPVEQRALLWLPAGS